MSSEDPQKSTHSYGGPAEPSQDSEAPLELLRVEAPSRHETRGELLRTVEAALTRFAVSGGLELDGDVLVLKAAAGVSREDVRFALARWNTQGSAERQAVAVALARKLVSPLQVSEPKKTRAWRIDLGLLGLVLVSCLVLGLFVYWSTPQPSEPRTPPSNLNPHSAGAVPPVRDRGQHVCETTRGRVFRGGLISMTDTEGWVVELALLGAPRSAPLERHPSLLDFVQTRSDGSGSYVWSGEPQLAMSTGSPSSIDLRPFSISSDENTRPGLILTFDGSFVESYFDEISRGKFHHLAFALSTAIDAEYSALFGRCSHDAIHTLGSWFWGKDSASVATSLLYFMGMYAVPRHLDALHFEHSSTGTADHSVGFAAIVRATTHIDRAALSTLVGSEGGMAVGSGAEFRTGQGNGGHTIITFPFRDGNRASRVSRTMARVTGLLQ